MTALTRTEPNPAFSRLAGDDRVAIARKALEANGFEVILVDDRDQAREAVLDLVPDGAEVMTNTSVTLDATGIAEAINGSERFDALRPKLFAMDRQTQAREMRRLAAAPDVAVGSVHAITEAGEVLIATASGSQLGPYPYTAGKVIWVAGTQKIVKDLEEGMRRLKEYTFPLEDARALEAYGMNSAIARVLTTFRELVPGRTTIVLVKENLGF